MHNKIITVVSGKGGTGKTTVVSNLAVAISSIGKSVLVFDADMSLANLDISFGVKPKKTIVDFVEGKATLQEVIIKVRDNIFMIPALSGLSEMEKLTQLQRSGVSNAVSQLKKHFDVILVDSPAGITSRATDYILDYGQVVVVLNNDILSLTDSFATIKTLHNKKGIKEFKIVNNKMTVSESTALFTKIKSASNKFLPNTILELSGTINDRKDFISALNSQKPLSLTNKEILNDFIDLFESVSSSTNSSFIGTKLYG